MARYQIEEHRPDPEHEPNGFDYALIILVLCLMCFLFSCLSTTVCRTVCKPSENCKQVCKEATEWE